MIRTLTGKHRWLLPVVFALSLTATLLLSGALFGDTTAGAAGDDVNPAVGNHIHSADLHESSRFTGPGVVWPPRPDGAGPAQLVPEATAPSSDSISVAVQVAANDAQVASALGASWSVTDLEEGVSDGKGQVDAAKSQVQFYSLSTNQTVTATLTNDAVTAVEYAAPSDYQPPLSATEAEAAAAIARSYWEGQNAAGIDGLQGYSIRAFDPNGDFYDVRMAYVSFHVDSDSLPLYVSNIDLTNGTVLDARVES